jgi:GNAT superfamily N-acetyltransferase
MTSTDSFSAPHVVCRPALPLDAADVLEFTKFIWDGHDYIQYVWKDWFADPHGLLAVAQYGPHAVGMAKVTLLSPGQWWLEGLRVDPRFQGMKIGSHLHEYMDAWWLSHCDGTLRLMTSSQRAQVHHLCERTGYTKVAEVTGYDAPALAEASHAFQAIGPDDVPEAAKYARRHSSLPWGQLMDSGWRFSAPDEPALMDTARQQRLFWWRGRDALFASWEDDDDSRLGVGLAAAAAPDLTALLMDARRLAAEKHLASVRWHAPLGDEVQTALQAAGYVTDWDNSAYLYAKPHTPPTVVARSP